MSNARMTNGEALTRYWKKKRNIQNVRERAPKNQSQTEQLLAERGFLADKTTVREDFVSPSHSLGACLLQLHHRRFVVFARAEVSVLVFFPPTTTLAVRRHILKAILACPKTPYAEKAVHVMYNRTTRHESPMQ